MASLTIPDVCTRLNISRSTCQRWLHSGQLPGIKKHACGTICSSPNTCQQGSWEIPEAAVKAILWAPHSQAG